MAIEDCSIEDNKLNGVLVRDGAAPRLLRNAITGNGAFGVVLQVRSMFPLTTRLGWTHSTAGR